MVLIEDLVGNPGESLSFGVGDRTLSDLPSSVLSCEIPLAESTDASTLEHRTALDQLSCDPWFLTGPSKSPDCVSLSEMYWKLELFTVPCKSSFLTNLGADMAEKQTLNHGKFTMANQCQAPKETSSLKGSPSLAISNMLAHLTFRVLWLRLYHPFNEHMSSPEP